MMHCGILRRGSELRHVYTRSSRSCEASADPGNLSGSPPLRLTHSVIHSCSHAENYWDFRVVVTLMLHDCVAKIRWDDGGRPKFFSVMPG